MCVFCEYMDPIPDKNIWGRTSNINILCVWVGLLMNIFIRNSDLCPLIDMSFGCSLNINIYGLSCVCTSALNLFGFSLNKNIQCRLCCVRCSRAVG